MGMSEDNAAYPVPKADRYRRIRELSQVIKGRYILILLCIIVVNALVFLHVYGSGKLYTATSQILVRLSQPFGVSPSAAPQLSVLQSDALLERLIVEQGLYRITEFGGLSAATDFYALDRGQRDAIRQAVRDNLVIKSHDDDAAVIDISFKSGDPVLAVTVANALAHLYADAETSVAKVVIKEELNRVAAQADGLGYDVHQAQKAYDNAVASQSGEVSSMDAETYTREMEKLTRQYDVAQESMMETGVALDQMKALLADESQELRVPVFVDLPLFVSLRQEEDDLLQYRAQAEKDGEDKDTLKAADEVMVAFRKKLRGEIENYIESLQLKRDIQSSEVKALSGRMEDLKAAYNGSRGREADIVAARVQLEMSKTLLENFAQSYLKSLQDDNYGKEPVRILTMATSSREDVHPPVVFVFLYAVVVGYGVAFLIAVAGVFFRRVVYGPAQLESLTGLPVYAMLPRVKFLRGRKVVTYLSEKPASAMAETMRTLLTTIRLQGELSAGDRCRVLTVTSTCPDEGKTTISAWLATTAAQNGKKVLVIDADMRRPSLHKTYGIGNARGLADYLSDRLPLVDTIYRNHPSGVHLMTGKAIPVHALMLLSSGRMESLVRRLKDSYDLIIIDAPTSLVFSDARVLARLSDQVFYIVEWNKTVCGDICEVMRSFFASGRPKMAFIINKVNNNNMIRFNRREMSYLNYFGKKKK